MRPLLFFSFIVLLSLSVHAQLVPQPQGFVLDSAGMLTLEQEQALEMRLQTLENDTSVEVAIYIFPTLEGGDMFLYTQSVFEAWKIGQKEKNNGLLITIATQDREWRIHTGYGLEGTLPDALAFQVGSYKLVPYLRDGDYYNGLSAALDDIEGLVKSDPSVQATYEEKSLFEEPFELFGWGFGMAIVAFFLLILTMIRTSVSVKGEHRLATMLGTFFFLVTTGIWVTFFVGFLCMYLFGGFYGFSALAALYGYLLLFAKFPLLSGFNRSGSHHSGGFGGFSGGSFGGGGFGGGGFGGGMSGGGGAGGRF